MTSQYMSAPRPNPDSCRYQLTAKGRACVDVVEAQVQTLGSLSRYLHDVLLTCAFTPPRPPEESLRALLALGLIEYAWV